uniref:Uncharacterized protein n=1 Tax=Ditylenchus dipsaci TaxID=166011 RepID=A0A915EA19_9BILA
MGCLISSSSNLPAADRLRKRSSVAAVLPKLDANKSNPTVFGLANSNAQYPARITTASISPHKVVPASGNRVEPNKEARKSIASTSSRSVGNSQKKHQDSVEKASIALSTNFLEEASKSIDQKTDKTSLSAFNILKSLIRLKRSGSTESPRPSLSSSEMSILSQRLGSFSLPDSYLLDGFSIDTSRAKSNAQTVSFCAQKLGMIEYSDGRDDQEGCDIHWHNIIYTDMKNVVKGTEARVNKFPGMTELAKKIALTQAIRSMKELFPLEYQFYPNSWVIPAQLSDFHQHCMEVESKGEKSCYIVKPDDGAQGSGIYLISSVEELLNTVEKQLVQEYMGDPFLLEDDLKFDFRVYAVIKSINPLSIYVAREGMARFCTEKYVKPTPENFSNLYAHLTNYSLNKAHNSYMHSKSLKDQLQGSKRLLSTVLHQMEWKGVRTRRLWHDIKMIVVKTVLAMVPEIMLNYESYFCDMPGPQCFQIMGFDVIVRRDGVPFLLEVNSAPSLSIDHTEITDSNEVITVRSIVDEMIKVPLVNDCLLLVMNRLHSDRETYQNTRLDSEALRGSVHLDNKSISTADVGASAGAPRDAKRKAHLSEIFPGRYGQNSKHLLILDRAVYLFMQFANVKQSLLISMPAIKAFLRKCNLADLLTAAELEQQFSHINFYFTNKPYGASSSLPFHGFLLLLFGLARLKFKFCEDTLAALLRLLAYCDSSLRYYGVRSTRLRRTELEQDENANLVEIYLLPSRMRRSSANNNSVRGNNTSRRQISVGARLPRRARSLPRHSIKTVAQR